MNRELREKVDEFVEAYAKFGTPEGARNRCGDACVTFLSFCGIPGEYRSSIMACGEIMHPKTGVLVEHFWLVMGPYCLDFTARQFDPEADFPLVWKSNTGEPRHPWSPDE